MKKKLRMRELGKTDPFRAVHDEGRESEERGREERGDVPVDSRARRGEADTELAGLIKMGILPLSLRGPPDGNRAIEVNKMIHR